MFKFNNINKYFIIIFISWLSLWLSLGTLPSNLNYNISTYLDLFNYLRVYSPLFFSFVFLMLIIVKYFNFFFNDKKKNSKILNLFLVYFLFQIIGLYQNDELKFNIENLYLAILGICTIKILIINQFLNTNKNLQYLLYSALVLCILSSSFFFYSNLIANEFYSLRDIFNIRVRGFYDINLDKKFFLENIMPRSTGISRTFGLINVFIIIYLIFIKKKKNFIIYFISTIYTFLIWSLESRGSVLIFFLTIIFIIYLSKKLNLKEKIYAAFYFLLLPIILFETIMFLNKDNLFTKYNNSNISHQVPKNDITVTTNKIRLIKDYTSSGRIDIWNSALTSFDKKKLFGYGPQGDRFILSSSFVSKKFYNNSSNALVYSLLSGGYFGFLVMLLIYFYISFKIYIFSQKVKIFNNSKEITLKVTVCYILFFLVRSVFENSFAVFSIDFMIFILSGLYIENHLKRIPSYNFKVLKYS